MKKISMSLATAVLSLPCFAESPDFIKNMTGCFIVTYRFVEDGEHDKYIPESAEEAVLSEANGVYSIQRYGIFEGERVKHFREDWARDLDQQGNSKADAEGHPIWTQKVYGPAGNFRYECTSPLVFNQFHCQVKNTPKPQRDRNRADYQTLDRDHFLQITPKGWVQAENNVKVRTSGKARSNEVGWIEYKRVESEKCQPTKKPD